MGQSHVRGRRERVRGHLGRTGQRAGGFGGVREKLVMGRNLPRVRKGDVGAKRGPTRSGGAAWAGDRCPGCGYNAPRTIRGDDVAPST